VERGYTGRRWRRRHVNSIADDIGSYGGISNGGSTSSGKKERREAYGSRTVHQEGPSNNPKELNLAFASGVRYGVDMRCIPHTHG
jgi:hypothetical protein